MAIVDFDDAVRAAERGQCSRDRISGNVNGRRECLPGAPRILARAVITAESVGVNDLEPGLGEIRARGKRDAPKFRIDGSLDRQTDEG